MSVNSFPENSDNEKYKLLKNKYPNKNPNNNSINNINNINQPGQKQPILKSDEGIMFPPINPPKYKPSKKNPYDQKKPLFSSLKKPLNQYNFNIKKNKKETTVYN